MRFLSLFSGIEAASTAWSPLGWTCAAVSEIEPFPCAVLAQRHPGVPNLGNVMSISEDDIRALGPLDLVVFGSPCQDLSVAGKREGLSGERSGLFWTAMRIVSWAREHCGARYALWENVPGAFSSNRGADFAAVVGAMAGLDDVPVPPKGWGTEGCALGSQGLVEWAVLDAQWFGVAQRRRRVFALVDFGDWSSRPPILLEPQGLRGHPAPRREAGEKPAPTISARPTGGGGLGTDFGLDGGLIAAYGGNNTAGPIEVATALNDMSPTLRAGGHDGSHANAGVPPTIAFALRGRDGGAMPEVEGVGDRIGALRSASGGSSRDYVVFDTTQITSPANYSNPQPGDPCHPLAAGAHPPAIAYGLRSDLHRSGEAKTPSADAEGRVRLRDAGFNPLEEMAPTLDAGAPHAVAFSIMPMNSGKDFKGRETDIAQPVMAAGPAGGNQGGDYVVQPPLAFNARQDPIHRPVTGPLDTDGTTHAFSHGSAVRRLTPLECARLQGFPDDYLDIQFRGKPAADGPKYKALGNSMAVPVMAWIGMRIEAAGIT